MDTIASSDGVRKVCCPDGYEKYGHLRELTSRLLRDEAVQMLISAKLAALPEDYDPWIRRIERNRAYMLGMGTNSIPGETTDSPHVQSQMQRLILFRPTW